MNEFTDRLTGDEERDSRPSQEIANKLRVFGEERGFDKETCNEIAQLHFEEAFETAYGYLLQAGFDPDEILADFIEPTESGITCLLNKLSWLAG